jgi:DNA-directed RNA polymerase subunit RPC12/RpoP
MYAVVGCNGCSALWLLSDPDESERAQCPRCGKRHRTAKLRRLYQSPERDAARQVRAAILAERQGAEEAFDALPSVSELEADAAEAGVGDAEYLAALGVDPDEVAAAAERGSGGDGGSSRDRATVVRDAVRAVDDPTEAAVVDYATARGVPAEAARDLLDRLVRRGEATEHDGRYRLL